MNFLKDKVRKYQEKKLEEANQKLKNHTEIKNQLEKQLKSEINEGMSEVKKNLEKQKEFIKIWEKNIAGIKKQIKKLKS